jgi:hypothetical protein
LLQQSNATKGESESTEKRRRKRRRGASASANARSEGKGGRAMRIGRRSRNPDAYRTIVDESG